MQGWEHPRSLPTPAAPDPLLWKPPGPESQTSFCLQFEVVSLFLEG